METEKREIKAIQIARNLSCFLDSQECTNKSMYS